MCKILINGLLLNNNFSGVQYYTENLIKALGSIEKAEIKYDVLLSNIYEGKIQSNQIVNKINCGFDTTNRIRRIFFENFKLQNYYKNKHYHLYHSPSYILPYNWGYPSVLTIHDLIALDFPEFCRSESAKYFDFFLPRSIKKANCIIAVSNKVKEDIIKHFRIDPDKINVIYHGIADTFLKIEAIDKLSRVKKLYHLPDNYILFVGNIEPKKNLERLICAFKLLRNTHKLDHKLVIAGKKGWKYNTVFRTIEELEISDKVIFTGYVPEEDLPVIYSMSDLFVFPSLYEGFGIPPLEAMACEVPVLVSNKGALPEVTGGKCLQIDPYNVGEIAEGMYKLLTDIELRDRSIQQGKEWVKHFSWEKAAIETYMVYKQTIQNNETGI